MSFVDCILKAAKDGEIDRLDAENIVRKFEESLADAKTKNPNLSDADIERIAQDEVDSFGEAVMKSQRQEVDQALALLRVNSYYNTSGLPASKASFGYMQNTANRVSTAQHDIFRMIDDVTAETFDPGVSGLGRGHEDISRAVGMVISGQSDGSKAGQIAKSFREANDYIVKRLQLAGVEFNVLPNYFPPVNNKRLIAKVDKEEFVRDVVENVGEGTWTKEIGTGDNKRKVRKTREELEDEVRVAYDNIVTGGANQIEEIIDIGRLPKGGTSPNMSLSSRRQHERFFHWDDPQKFAFYNNKYGVGDKGLAQAFLTHVRRSATDIALAEMLGPKPGTTLAFMKEKMRVDKKGLGFRYSAQSLDNHFRALVGNSLDPDNRLDQVLLNLMNLTRAAQLGSAGLSAFPDIAFVRLAMHMNGLNANRATYYYMKSVLPGGSELKQTAKSYGLIADMVTGGMHADNRLTGSIEKTKGFTNYLAQQTNRFSGLTRITESGKTAAALETYRTIGESSGKAWGKLDKNLIEALKKNGIDQSDWEMLNLEYQKHNKFISEPGAGEATFINTPKMKQTALEENNFQLLNLANKIDDFADFMGVIATNEGTLSNKVITSGNVFGGSRTGLIAGRMMFQYANFPLSSFFNHFVPALKNHKGRLATSAAFATALGYFSIASKDASRGRTPPPIDSPETWKRSLIQGGTAGMLLDVVGNDPTEFGNHFTDPFVKDRPVPSKIQDFIEAIWYGGKSGRDALWASYNEYDMPKDNLAKMFKSSSDLLLGVIPMQNLFYIRPWMENVLLDGARRLTDPTYDQRRERMMEYVYGSGQSFFFPPGGEMDLDILGESIDAEIEKLQNLSEE